MSDTPRTIVHEWFERVWNRGEVGAIDDLLAPDAVVHGLGGVADEQMRGPAGFRPLYTAFRQAFPDMRIDVEDCIGDGDMLAFRCVVRATHTGEGIGVAPAGRAVEFPGMGFIRVRDGKIVEAWNTFDFHGMYTQLGHQLTPAT